jgi:hypothetical protein
MPYPPKGDPVRAALEHLTDLTDLLGLGGVAPGRHGGVRLDLSAGQAHGLADVLLTGCLARQLALSPDTPVWCTRLEGVGTVVRIVRHEVTLRSVETGERWDVQLSDIRPATLAEIRAADMPRAAARAQ